MSERTAWLAVVQRGDEIDEQETEVVTLEGVSASPGATIETTDGTRITLTAPTSEAA